MKSTAIASLGAVAGIGSIVAIAVASAVLNCHQVVM